MELDLVVLMNDLMYRDASERQRYSREILHLLVVCLSC